MRRSMTPEELRQRSETCRRERQHLLRYAIWNSRRIREAQEKEDEGQAVAAGSAANSSKQDDKQKPKRLALQPIQNTSENSRLAGSCGNANCRTDEDADDTSSESSDTSASDPDSDNSENLSDRVSKLDRSEYRPLLKKSYTERLSEAEMDSDSSSDESDDSWSDCEDLDEGDCSCCDITTRRASGDSNEDLTACFQRMSKRFNAMMTSVNQTRI
ncbi:clumping factor A-like [Schistocerca cancellata]|uniref:clumping factor A-like n=1 Tax=Schistocerca cancellata TaxID=274614 RepID=UPI00211731EA|nr:clumping factor A-like [Schistocerca cancellata]